MRPKRPLSTWALNGIQGGNNTENLREDRALDTLSSTNRCMPLIITIIITINIMIPSYRSRAARLPLRSARACGKPNTESTVLRNTFPRTTALATSTASCHPNAGWPAVARVPVRPATSP